MPGDKLDDGKTAIQSRPRPGAYLLENMRGTAEYWLNAARNVEDRDEAVLAIEQVANCWKNAAYDFAEKLHFSGYLNQPGAPLPETGSIEDVREKLRKSIEREQELEAKLASKTRDADHFFQLSGRYLEELNALQSAIQPIHAAGDDGWTDWQKPTMRGYKMQCCDCGLVHETEFRIFKVEESPSPDEHYGHVVSPDDYRLQFRMKRGSGHQAPMKLWLWRNFVDGDPQYWAFESPFPTFENGDPITLGSPAGYAIVKPCADGRNGRTDESVIEEIKRVLAKTPLSTTQPISKEK